MGAHLMRALGNLIRHTWRCWRAYRAAKHAQKRRAEALLLLNAALDFFDRSVAAEALAIVNFAHEVDALKSLPANRRKHATSNR